MPTPEDFARLAAAKGHGAPQDYMTPDPTTAASGGLSADTRMLELFCNDVSGGYRMETAAYTATQAKDRKSRDAQLVRAIRSVIYHALAHPSPPSPAQVAGSEAALWRDHDRRHGTPEPSPARGEELEAGALEAAARELNRNALEQGQRLISVRLTERAVRAYFAFLPRVICEADVEQAVLTVAEGGEVFGRQADAMVGYELGWRDGNNSAATARPADTAVASAAPESAWRTMDSAPKGVGERFILLSAMEPEGDRSTWFAKWQGGRWYGVDELGLTRSSNGHAMPTHWQPLPAPPASAPAADAEGGA